MLMPAALVVRPIEFAIVFSGRIAGWTEKNKMTDTYSEFRVDAENRRIFEQESLATEATELISGLMEAGHVTKADLARKIGKSKAFVTQLLGGSRNMTMHTLADLAFALGHRIDLEAKRLSPAVGTDCSRSA